MNHQAEISLRQKPFVSLKELIYSWIIIFTSASFLVYKYVLQMSPSVITHELMNAYSLSGTSLGVLASLYFYTYMVMQIPAGILLDQHSIKKLTCFAVGIC